VTALTEAADDLEIRHGLAGWLRSMDADFVAPLCTARERGKLDDDADPAGQFAKPFIAASEMLVWRGAGTWRF